MDRKKLKWIIEIEVSATWIEDGFDIPEDEGDKGEGWIVDRLQECLPYAYTHELGGRVIKAPPRHEIRKLQGYRD